MELKNKPITYLKSCISNPIEKGMKKVIGLSFEIW